MKGALGEVRAILAGRHALTALRAGSGVIVRRGGRWIAAEPLMRGGAGAFFVYVAVDGALAQPQALAITAPAAVGAWVAAAWALAPTPAPARVVDDAEQLHESGPVEAFTRWLYDLIGERPGVHLAELYPAMRALPGHEHRDDAALREALRALGIPVRRSLRIGTVAGRSGVHRGDLPPLPCPPGELGGESGGGAGQTADSPAGEQAESAMESGR